MVTTSDGVTLTERDYTVSYSNNKNVGPYLTTIPTGTDAGSYKVTAGEIRQ